MESERINSVPFNRDGEVPGDYSVRETVIKGRWCRNRKLDTTTNSTTNSAKVQQLIFHQFTPSWLVGGCQGSVEVRHSRAITRDVTSKGRAEQQGTGMAVADTKNKEDTEQTKEGEPYASRREEGVGASGRWHGH